MIKETLKKLGLSDKEITIYLALLPLGKSPASALAKRTGIMRSTAQYTCQQLAKKGIIRSIKKNNSFIYYPESPDNLLVLLEKEKKAIVEKEHQVERIIGDLTNMINPEASLPQVQFFSGVDGINRLFKDALNDDYPLFGAWYIDEDIHPEVSDYTNKEWLPLLKKLKLPNYSLVNDNPATLKYLMKTRDVYRKHLILPKKDFPFSACCHIYGNKVAFYSYRTHDLTGVLIENENIRQTQMALFRLAWDSARKHKMNLDRANLELPL